MGGTLLKFVLATHNKNKVKEIESILEKIPELSEASYTVITAEEAGVTEDIEETGSTFEENARIKAAALSGRGFISVADDSGLEVDALDGAPGVYSARYSGGGAKENNRKLLSELDGVPEEKRGARFVSAICCILPDGREFTCRGECPGRIISGERGEGGFGYDPLFLYEPLGKTFAELSADEKNSVSHRANALKSFASELSVLLGSEEL